MEIPVRLTLLVPNNLGSSLAFKAPSPSVGKVAVKVMILPPIVPYKCRIKLPRQLDHFVTHPATLDSRSAYERSA